MFAPIASFFGSLLSSSGTNERCEHVDEDSAGAESSSSQSISPISRKRSADSWDSDENRVMLEEDEESSSSQTTSPRSRERSADSWNSHENRVMLEEDEESSLSQTTSPRSRKRSADSWVCHEKDEHIDRDEDEAVIDGLKWSRNPILGIPTPTKRSEPRPATDYKSFLSPFRGRNAGSTVKDMKLTKPEQYIGLFVDDHVLDTFVTTINSYAAANHANGWRDVVKAEMRGFFSIIMYLGIIKCPERKEVAWNEGSTGLRFCRASMSLNRFQMLLNNLHWLNTSDTTATNNRSSFTVETFCEYLAGRYQTCFNSLQCVDADEMVNKFKEQLVTYYPARQRKGTWQPMILFHFLHVTTVNAYILFKEEHHAQKGEASHRLMDFILRVCEAWKYESRDTIVSPTHRKSYKYAERLEMGDHIPIHRPSYTDKITGKRINTRKVCIICKKQVVTGCSECGIAVCLASNYGHEPSARDPTESCWYKHHTCTTKYDGVDCNPVYSTESLL